MRYLILFLFIPTLCIAQPPQWQQYIRYEKVTQAFSVTVKQLSATQRLFARITADCYDGGNQYYRVWDSLTTMYPMISATTSAQGVDAKNLNGTYNFVYTGAPTVADGTFTAASSKYAETNLPANVIPQNSRHYIIYITTNTAAGTGKMDAGIAGSAPFEFLNARYNSSGVLAALSGAGGLNPPVIVTTRTDSCWVITRTSSSRHAFYRNGDLGAITTATSSAPNSNTITVGRGLGTFSDRTYSYFGTGRALTTVQMAGYSKAVTIFNTEK